MEGNQQKMREVLEWLLGFGYSTTDGGFHMPDVKMARNKIERALSAPPRQCDVGTAEEQTKRMRNNCNKYKPSCIGCKHITDLQKVNCWLAWAQMPYAQEGGEE